MKNVQIVSSFGRLAAVAAAMTLGPGPMVNPSPQAAPKVRRRPSVALRELNGHSFRSLRRAFNAGWNPPVPDEKAMMRHAWYRKKLYWDAMRKRLGQDRS